jgi:hypothetical protein
LTGADAGGSINHGALMSTLLLAATLLCADGVRSYEVRLASDGWESTERQDQRLVQRRHYSDWHRVERTLERYKNQIADLRAQGWRVVSTDSSSGSASSTTTE